VKNARKFGKRPLTLRKKILTAANTRSPTFRALVTVVVALKHLRALLVRVAVMQGARNIGRVRKTLVKMRDFLEVINGGKN
jgi:hypothetical protein